MKHGRTWAGECLHDVTRLVDRRLQGRLPTGVDRVNLEYVRHFGDGARALIRWRGLWVALSGHDSGRLFDALQAPGAGLTALVHRWVAKALPHSALRGVPRGAVLFNVGHSGLDRPGYGARIEQFGLRTVFFLHDLIPITYAEYGRAGEAARHERRLQTMLAFARGVVVNSNDTLQALEAYARARGVSLPPCEVAPLAPVRLPPPAAKAPFDVPYFVTLGTIEPRKNHLLLLHVWRELARTLGSNAPRLVIIGQRGWECEQVVGLLERCEALRGLVIENHRCSDTELSNYLHRARALLFPSFAEGYGLPLVEALACDTPVIASDLPVFREIAGDIPDYLHPLDGSGWRQAVLDYAQTSSPRRAAQLVRLQGFTAPTWEVHFARVDAFLCRLGLMS